MFPTVFEAGSVAEGASGRTGGLVLEGTAAGPLDEVRSCVPELNNLVTAEAIDCGLHLPGCWEIEHKKSRGKPALPWDDLGRPVQVARTVSGGVVEPARLLTGMLNAALRLGAEVRENTPAIRIVAKPRPAVELTGEIVYPEHIVVAVNAWLPALLPPGDVSVHSSLTFACATQPLDASTLGAIGMAAGIPFYTVDLPYLWGRTMDDGRAIFGSGLVFGSPQQLEENDVSAGSSRAALAQLEERVRGLHPKLRAIGLSASWGGPIAFTPDAVPLVGRLPASRNIIVASAYSGHGVALSVRIGQLIARAIAEDTDLPRWGALDRKTSSHFWGR
jgi:glycine/D-amino acid oxidase-like deaminating enzyme